MDGADINRAASLRRNPVDDVFPSLRNKSFKNNAVDEREQASLGFCDAEKGSKSTRTHSASGERPKKRLHFLERNVSPTASMAANDVLSEPRMDGRGRQIFGEQQPSARF